MSEKARIKIKLGYFEFEVEGNEEFVNSIIGSNIMEFVESFEKFDDRQNRSVEPQDLKDMETDNLEILDISKAEGPSDALRLLLKSDWGKRPHSVSEIIKALELNAKYYDYGSLTGTLTYLVKKGEFRRIGEKGNYKYLNK